MTVSAEQIVLDAETRIRAWSRGSVHREPSLTLEFADPDELAPFASCATPARRGARYRLVLIRADGETQAADANDAPGDTGRYADQAERLRSSRFFDDLRVLEALGTDDQFLSWVTYQRSIVTGLFNEIDDSGDCRCVACHVRRAGDAGTGYKPKYSCVPMTDDEHMRQHQGGEFAVYAYWRRINGKPVFAQETNTQAAAWFDQQMHATRMRWAEHRLCSLMRAPGLSHVAPLDLMQWAREMGVVGLLPGQGDERAHTQESVA